jgi:hypothetical protein
MIEEELTGFGKYDYFDWWDHDKVKELNDKHSKQWIQLYKKVRDAKEKGDEKALDKARQAFRKHEEKGRKYKEKAKETYYYWC